MSKYFAKARLVKEYEFNVEGDTISEAAQKAEGLMNEQVSADLVPGSEVDARFEVVLIRKAHKNEVE